MLPMPDSLAPMEIAARFRALRKALGYTQEELTRKADPTWPHVYAARVERGENKLTSRATRARFAGAFGLTPTDFEAYLSGVLDLRDAVERSKASRKPEQAPAGPVVAPPVPALPQVPPAPEGVSEGRQALADSALGAAFDAVTHSVADLLAVRQSLLRLPLEMIPGGELVAFVRCWLDAAVALRGEGHPALFETLAARVTLLKSCEKSHR